MDIQATTVDVTAEQMRRARIKAPQRKVLAVRTGKNEAPQRNYQQVRDVLSF